jgi:hypothetical protein
MSDQLNGMTEDFWTLPDFGFPIVRCGRIPENADLTCSILNRILALETVLLLQ